MTQEQTRLYPSLNQLLLQPEENWEDKLPAEQYFALVLAYNDKISGQKRELKSSRTGKVYALTDREMTCLQLAFRSAGDESVAKELANSLNPTVRSVVLSDATRHEKLLFLHNQVVNSLYADERFRKVKNQAYRKASQRIDEIASSQNLEMFKQECELLKNLGDRKMIESIIVGKTDSEKEGIEANISQAVSLSLENVFAHVYRAVSCETQLDAFQRLGNEEEAV